MAVLTLYSKRKKEAERNGEAEIYQYDEVPQPLRIQVVHIWDEVLGDSRGYDNDKYERWKFIHDAMAREKGLLELRQYSNTVSDSCREWFLENATADDALDMIELTFNVLGNIRYSDVKPEDAIRELNIRFRENSTGYQFENGRIIKLDNYFLHSEVIKPALKLLTSKIFKTANDDFITAHQHYKHQQYKDCIVAAQRAFESCLKAICTAKEWTFSSSDRASELIKIVRNNGLFPDYLDKGFDTYIAMMKTGLPDVRNNAGGHGTAPDASPVSDYIAAYALHMTAANMTLVAKAANL